MLTEGNHYRPLLLSNLAAALALRSEIRGNLDDLREAVARGREAIGLAPDNSPGRAMYLRNLSAALLCLHEWTGAPEHASESVATARQALRLLGDDSRDRAAYLANLGASLAAECEARRGETTLAWTRR